ncbi:hypothetical protein NPIL_357791 [Nephila pilipes]|uniref:Uncharacterized protein n=1 Tax=Nephila pilipes TaxID=299642 RepID=A0A8X6NS19_NEPPI|nr:hypothetical protein NPIL_357791 [Nephila pilipes]
MRKHSLRQLLQIDNEGGNGFTKRRHNTFVTVSSHTLTTTPPSFATVDTCGNSRKTSVWKGMNGLHFGITACHLRTETEDSGQPPNKGWTEKTSVRGNGL